MSLLGYFGVNIADGFVTLSLVTILMIVYLVYLHAHYAGTPPGPWSLPIFGYLFFFSKKPYQDFVKLGNKYGNVFSVKIGSRNVVVLNDYESIQSTFVKQGDIYAGKPHDGIAGELGDYKSVFVTDGKQWREQRSFLLSSLRDFGFGKRRMEERIQEEASLIINKFVENKTMEISEVLACGVTNIIGCLMFGERFSYEDKEIVENVNIIGELVASESHFTIVDALPTLQNIIPMSILGLDKIIAIKKSIYDFVDRKIKEHKATFDANNIRDVIDTYLLKLEQNKKTGQINNHNVFTDDYVRANAVTLFGAGTDTTNSTLKWALKLLAVNPDIQTQMQNEIDEIIGRERPPSMSDKTKMPFTEATLLEIDRFVTLLPLTLYHRITEDTVLKGYKIHKNTFVLANLWNVHYNTEIWKNPHQFNPHRFLDSDGKINDLREYVIPFSIGKRNCLGESLAKMEIFLFLTCFLQKLTFSPTSEGMSLDTMSDIPVRRPKTCLLSIKSRD